MNRLRGGAGRQGPSGERLGRRRGLRRKGLALVGAGALAMAVAAPAMAVGPGDLDPNTEPDVQEGGWDLVASQECPEPVVEGPDCIVIFDGGPIADNEVSFAQNVDNASGWSYEEDTTTGYAVLDPRGSDDPTEESTASLVSRDYADADGNPLAGFSASVTLRTADDGEAGPRLRLRIDPLGDGSTTCRLMYFFPDSVPAWDTFYVTTHPEEDQGGWRTQRCPDDPAGGTSSYATWQDVLDAFPAALIVNGTGLPGVSIEAGDPDATDAYRTTHVDSATINGGFIDFDAPTLGVGLADPAAPIAPINAGEPVDVELTATLSGPNQATIFNEVNFLTGAGGLDSGGTFGQTEGPDGLCTVEVTEPVVPDDPANLFPPERGLSTRPLGDGGLSVVERVATVTVTVTASADVPQGGQCVIGIVDPLNAEPIGNVTIQVNDTREAPALPTEVPADAGALTVEPECVVEGDTMTVTAPAGSFSPESLVSVGLYDSGIDLAEERANPDGSLSIEGPLPNGVPDGPQEVLAVGYASTDNDDLTSLSAEFEVGCPDGGGGSGGIPNGIPAGGGTDDGNGLLGTGLATILAIGGFLGLRRWIRG